MKTYEQLKSISEVYTDYAKKIPNNPFSLCTRLQIQYKMKPECVKDFKGRCPLDITPAILCKAGTPNHPDNIVYLDESSVYWQFYAFHELSHHILEHEGKSTQEEYEANMLACLLIASPQKLPTYLKSAEDLSHFAEIPIGRAEEYWQYICKPARNKIIKKFKPIAITMIAVIAIASIGINIVSLYRTQANENIDDNYVEPNHNDSSIVVEDNVVTPPANLPELIIDTSDSNTMVKDEKLVYVTPTGSKYHEEGCRHINKSSHIRELSVRTALDEGYTPCKDCMP